MSQLSLFDEPTIARYKNRFEISDGKHYLGYIDMNKPSNGTVVFEFKYCKGRAYGGADEVPIKDMQMYIKHTARHFLKLYRYRNETTKQLINGYVGFLPETGKELLHEKTSLQCRLRLFE